MTDKSQAIPTSPPVERPRDAFATLLGVVASFHRDDSELEWLLELIETARPGFVATTLARADDEYEARAAARAARDAEARARTIAEEAAGNETNRAAWAAWLDAGGRDALATWEPLDVWPDAAPVDGVWLALGADDNFLGAGHTPREAHLTATEWARKALADPVEAADAFDPPGTETVATYLGTAETVRFVFLASSEAGLAADIAARVCRTT